MRDNGAPASARAANAHAVIDRFFGISDTRKRAEECGVLVAGVCSIVSAV